MKNKMKWLFPLIAVLLLLPWPVAYAYSYSGDVYGQGEVRIEVALPSAQPAYTVFGRAIGGISNPGELFYIDTTDSAADIVTELYITNAQELIHHYRYLIFKVGVYVESEAGEWMKASSSSGELIPDTYITMRDGQVSFTLPGYAKYKVTIDSGVFYCTNAKATGDDLSPQFYLTVD
jgi:hypothetical protein